MPWYTLRGPVRVVDDEEDVEVDDEGRLRALDGLGYDEETLAGRLDDPSLEDADLEGGTVELLWVEDHLEVRTAFEAAGTLDPVQIDALRAFTFAQWSSGVGAELVAEHLGRTGLRLELGPEDENDIEVLVEQS